MTELSRAQELIQRYLDQRAAADELRELASFLTADAHVADELALAAEIDSLLEQRFREEGHRRDVEEMLGLWTVEPDGNGLAAIVAELESAPTVEQKSPLLPVGYDASPADVSDVVAPRRSRSKIQQTLWIVAASLLVAAGGLLVWQGSGPWAREHRVLSGQILIAGQPAARVHDGAPLVVGGEEPAIVELADGSQARLAPASQAIVHGRQGNVREVVELVQGSGIFRVEKGNRQFRVQTTAGNVTALGTEFSVELRPSEPKGEQDMRSVQPGLMALVVAVVVGSVEVELRTQKFVLSTGDSRVFAAEPSEQVAQNEKKIKSLPLPSGDLLGLAAKTKGGASDRMFPGIAATLMLTDEQKEKIFAAREETLGSEAVRNAGVSIKSNPNATEQEKAKAQQIMKDAREDLQKKVDAILTSEQKALIEKLNAAAAESQQAASEVLKGEFADVKKDEAKFQEMQQRVRERAASEFKTRAASFLKPEQMAAMDKAAEEQKAAEERAKNNPKKK